jgi:spermidine/putrescine transport system ATP-binding protein
MTADVRLDRVTKRFDDVVAVDDVSLEIENGRFYALLGPSGCGKTTTLRMVGGFEQPSAGTIHLGDREVSGLPPHRRDVNTVFQSYALFPHLSIFENVAFGLRRKGVKGADLRGRVHEMLRIVGLEGLGPRKPRQLSGGQQQRVALARALVNRPRVLLLDEPLGALDLKLRKEMQLELKRIQHDMGITFVHVTHDQEEAMTMADSIVVMNRGRIEQLGSPADLYERPATAFVAGFLGVSNLLAGTVEGPEAVRLEGGTVLRVSREALNGCTGSVAVGIRPEKLRIGANGGGNTLVGEVRERAYVGVSTQYVVTTPVGEVTVYVQGAGSHAPGEELELSFAPESTFVVERSAFRDDASSPGDDGRVRDKDAGSRRGSATGATEDAVSRRPAFPGGTRLRRGRRSTREGDPQ